MSDQEPEFVATEARHHVFRSQDARETSCKGDEDAVGKYVTEGIVEQLEVIYV